MQRHNDPKWDPLNVGYELIVTIEDTSDIECSKNLISNFCGSLSMPEAHALMARKLNTKNTLVFFKSYVMSKCQRPTDDTRVILTQLPSVSIVFP